MRRRTAWTVLLSVFLVVTFSITAVYGWPPTTGWSDPPWTDTTGDTGTDTGWLSPSANEANTNWGSPQNMYASDDSDATTSTTGADGATVKQYNFNIPDLSGATIDGIEVDIEAAIAEAVGTRRARARLMWNSRSSETSYKETPDVTTSDAYYTLGGPTDTWGRTWSPSDFTNANFAVRVTSNLQPSAPTFESYSEASSFGDVTSLNVPMPTGATEDDLLVAAFSKDASTGTLSAPVDWTVLCEIDTAGSRFLVAYKVAGLGESGPYTFSSDDADQMACGIARFSGVDTTNPINAQSSTNTGNDASPHCLAATTTVDNTLVLRIMGVTMMM